VTWLAKLVDKWDFHELGTLLYAIIDSDIDDLAFGDVVGGGDAELAYEAATGWKRFERSRTASARSRRPSWTAMERSYE
jgi:hypothetical protein